MDRLLLPVVDVQGRAAVRCNLDDEVIECAAGVLAGDFEDEVTSGAGLEPKALVWGENRVWERHVQVSSLVRYASHAQTKH